jgi:ribosomal protein S20
MAKRTNNKGTELRKFLREFVNHVINKDYALANANFNSAVRETMKARINGVLEENK